MAAASTALSASSLAADRVGGDLGGGDGVVGDLRGGHRLVLEWRRCSTPLAPALGVRFSTGALDDAAGQRRRRRARADRADGTGGSPVMSVGRIATRDP